MLVVVLFPFCASFRVQAGSVGSYSDIDTIIGEDQSGVGGCELGVRHCEGLRLLELECISEMKPNGSWHSLTECYFVDVRMRVTGLSLLRVSLQDLKSVRRMP